MPADDDDYNGSDDEYVGARKGSKASADGRTRNAWERAATTGVGGQTLRQLQEKGIEKSVVEREEERKRKR